MHTLYIGCLFLGVLFALVSLLAGDLIGHALGGMLDFLSFDALNPSVLAGGITVFGGAGILLTEYSGLTNDAILVLSLLISVFLSVLLYLGFVKPMNKSEMSTGFSMSELPGKIGEIIVPVPAQGFGEVMVRFGPANTLHTAASFDHRTLPAGTRVVIVEVSEGVALVSELELH
ncbi:NfeD family protein [Paenibacillus rhizophilus]|uniref:Protease n=1 Tax=Paenibacillus rhizophilus TaxID=1850366 RepID=A0A3N9PAU2_9BACL|nr:NfeD family protein [Paenibacillus rhizophilus]RQW12725.1 protease [Paenibacillus rhizophilus]